MDGSIGIVIDDGVVIIVVIIVVVGAVGVAVGRIPSHNDFSTHKI